MTVRRHISAAFALCVLLLGAGCTDRDNAPMPAEMDEPLYVQGIQLKRQGRYPEALSAFLKVIDKLGARSAPESHVEAGVIFLITPRTRSTPAITSVATSSCSRTPSRPNWCGEW